MNRPGIIGFLLPLFLLSALPGRSVAAANLEPFQARYDVYRNGDLIGEMEVELTLQGDRWSLSSQSGGTHGLALILGARDSEYAEGKLGKGRIRPDRYSRHTKIAGVDERWKAEFDWEAGLVNIVNDQNDIQLELGGGALDPLSLGLELRRRLGQDEPNLVFRLVSGDKLKKQQFRLLESETLETSLGCLETRRVERVRSNNRRYTRLWHAPHLDFISVRLEHGKTGGNHMELRISELKLGDSIVEPGPGCTAGPGTPTAF
jgi:hypothetical protein